MKVLREEIIRRYDDKKTSKSSLWSNLLIRIILLVAVILIIRYISNFYEVFSRTESIQGKEYIENDNHRFE